MNEIRFGYVGCGYMAQTVHLPNFTALPGCRLEAIAEARPGLLAKIADKYGVKRRYASHMEMARDEEIDAVGVSAGFVAQSAIARDLLRAGKTVFMEKPMAVSVSQAEKLLAAEKEGKSRLMVAYMKRYDAGNEQVKKFVDEFKRSGELGAITFARNHGFCGAEWDAGKSGVYVGSDEPVPAASEDHFPEWLPKDKRNGYVGYLQQYTHNVNLLRWLLDAREVKVRMADLDPKDGISGVVVLEVGGVRALIESGYVSHWGWDEHTQIYFENGWIRTEAPPLLLNKVPASVEVYRAGEKQELTRMLLGEPKDRWSWSYQREAAHFIECVRSGAPFRSGAEDTLGDVQAFESIYRKHLGLT